MTGRPRLGDLFDTAERHFTAAEACRGEITEPAAAVYNLRRLLAAMTGYLHRTMPGDGVSAVTGSAPQAATALLELLRSAGDKIAAACAELGADNPATAAGSTLHLSAAAGCLAAGCDLLASHNELDVNGARVARSDWAGHMANPDVQAALVAEIGQWSRRAASFATWLASVSGLIGGNAQADVASAGQMLWLAAEINRPKHAGFAATEPGREILRCFRHVASPDRIPPQVPESVGELRDGILVTAERLRSIAFHLPSEAATSSPRVSGPAWARAALASAVVSDISRRVLQVLAIRSTQLNSAQTGTERLDAAARALAGARDAWRHAAQLWQIMTTDTQAEFTPVTAETDDLVLRIGRLAFTGPDWMPTRAKRATLRNPAELAANADEFATVVCAVHHASDALARLARANRTAIGHLAAARRVYLSNRILEDERYGNREYVPVQADRLWDLQEAHQAVTRVCRHAARAMDAVAVEAGAPSAILAAIRPAAPSTDINAELAVLEVCVRDIRRPKGSRRRHEMVKTALLTDREVTFTPHGQAPRRAVGDNVAAADRVTARTQYGPVERRMRTMGVTDIGLLLEAATIDRASRNLLGRASAPREENRSQPGPLITADGNPATLAATDVPIAVPTVGEVRCPAVGQPRPSTSAATSEVGKTARHRASRSA